MKIQCFRQVCAGHTDTRTHRQSDLLGSLTEPKIDEEISTIKNTVKELELSLYGQWCAVKGSWSSSSRITYDKMFHSNTNMEISGTVLNTGTGMLN